LKKEQTVLENDIYGLEKDATVLLRNRIDKPAFLITEFYLLPPCTLNGVLKSAGRKIVL
jgi:hypothetical protein